MLHKRRDQGERGVDIVQVVTVFLEHQILKDPRIVVQMTERQRVGQGLHVHPDHFGSISLSIFPTPCPLYNVVSKVHSSILKDTTVLPLC